MLWECLRVFLSWYIQLWIAFSFFNFSGFVRNLGKIRLDYCSWKGLTAIIWSNCLTSSGLTKLKHVTCRREVEVYWKKPYLKHPNNKVRSWGGGGCLQTFIGCCWIYFSFQSKILCWLILCWLRLPAELFGFELLLIAP